MNGRAILLKGYTALPDGWPEATATVRDTVLVSDGEHLVGSRPFRGGHTIVASHATRAEEHAFPYQALAMPTADMTLVVPFVVDRDGFGLAESSDVPAPFDRFMVGGERLPEVA